MIDDLAITEARRRLRDAACNEQTSIALKDLLRLSELENKRLREENERLHFDILARNQSLDLMRDENERLRKGSEVGAAIERAARDLPVGDMIEITVENGSAVTVIYYGIGGWDTMDVDNGNRLADEINAAIDAARGGK